MMSLPAELGVSRLRVVSYILVTVTSLLACTDAVKLTNTGYSNCRFLPASQLTNGAVVDDESCLLQCHCAPADPVCDQYTGHCAAGCEDGWCGIACQVTDVSRHKQTSQSPRTDALHGSDLAIDHLVYPNLTNSEEDKVRFSVPGGVDFNWWNIDLGDTYVIQEILVYGVKDAPDFDEMKIYTMINNYERKLYRWMKWFHHLNEYPMIIKSTNDSRLARSVHLERPGTITISEVNILGYKYIKCVQGKFGPGCITNCNCQGTCRDIDGWCDGLCDVGYFGPDCQDSCNATSWGENCDQVCRCADPEEVCDKSTGYCESGCAAPYYGDGCKTILSMESVNIDASLREYNQQYLVFDVTMINGSMPELPAGISFALQFRVVGDDETWTSKSINQGRLSEFFYFVVDFEMHSPLINAVYEVQLVPIMATYGRQVHGVPTESAFAENGCRSSDAPECDSWCSCAGNVTELCLKAGEACYTDCTTTDIGNTCDLRLPTINEENVTSAYDNHNNVVIIQISYNQEEDTLPVEDFVVWWHSGNITSDYTGDEITTILVSRFRHYYGRNIYIAPRVSYNGDMVTCKKITKYVSYRYRD